MSNTLKLGNGKWATGKDTVLAFNDENNNFKPLPFSFSRASSGTVVNKAGLIETVGSGEPRIDFKDNTKGALLLEPQRANNLVQSNQFDTTWTIGASALDLTSGQSGVYGSNDAWLLKKNSTGARYIQQSLSLSSAQYSYSVYLKAESTEWVWLLSSNGSSEVTSYFDLQNGVVGTTGGSNLDSTNIESVGDGWYRCTITYTQATSFVRIYPADASGSISPTDDNGIYIQHAQLESGSYPTSIIPTSGSAVTRVADSNTKQVATNSVIGQTEGTIFYDINLNNIQTSSQYIGTLSDGGSTNRIQFLNNIAQDWQLFITASTISSNINLTTSTTGVGRYKIAIAYKSGDVVFYVNGVQKGTSTETFTFSNLLHFDLGQRYDDSLFFNNPINNSKLYNTRLSNSELAALTS